MPGKEENEVGAWLNWMRQQINCKKLEDWKIRKLRELGVFESKNYKARAIHMMRGRDFFDDVSAESHIDCQCSKLKKILDEKKGFPANSDDGGKWFKDQRKKYLEDKLTEIEIRKFEDIGVFDQKNYTGKSQRGHLKNFYAYYYQHTETRATT